MVFKELDPLDWQDQSTAVLVAVPDAEAIAWPSKGALVEVCNADEVPAQVIQQLAEYRRLGTGPGLLVPEQRRQLANFLLLKHIPVTAHRH